ncbi:MAG: urease subunit beta [Deltaproteobacteria bacterium]|nr:urease subunit beta [Deltaproteobacteria bacterium]
MIPGEYILLDGDIEINQDAEVKSIQVKNTADRPIQVGSHFHFFETNKGLEFDRKLAYGKRLNILPGTSVRFEPGQLRVVELVSYGGRRRVFGFRGLVMGDLDDKRKNEVICHVC